MSENSKSQHSYAGKIVVLTVRFGCILHMKTLFPYS